MLMEVERENEHCFIFCSLERERERFFPILIHFTGEEREFENFFFFVLLDEKERERERDNIFFLF